MPNVKLTKEQRDELGKTLAMYAQAGLDVQAQAPTWWNTVKANRINAIGVVQDTGQTNQDPGYPIFHVPLSGPRQRTLAAQICTVVAKQEPILLDTSDDDEIADGKQKVIDRVWLAGQFKRVFKQAVLIATDTDLAFMRLCPSGPGLCEWSSIHPKDMSVFPALPNGLVEATFMGHRITKPRRWAIQKQKAKDADGQPIFYGDAYDDWMLTQHSPQDDQDSRDVGVVRSGAEYDTAGPNNRADAEVEIWDCLVKLDLTEINKPKDEWTFRNEQWYQAVICKDDFCLLSLKEYEFSEPWYCEVRLLGSEDFYPETSVGRDLGPLQQEYSRLRSALYSGVMRSQTVTVIGPSPKNGEKMVSVGNLNILDSDDAVNNYLANNVRPDLQPIIAECQIIRMEADAVAGISQNTTGAKSPDQTATEASIVAQGVSTGIEDKIEMASTDLPRMGKLTLEFVFADQNGFAQTIALQDGVPEPKQAPMQPMQIPDMSQPEPNVGMGGPPVGP